MSDANHVSAVELLRSGFKEESERQIVRFEAAIHYAILAERERCAKVAEGNGDCRASLACGVACTAGDEIATRIRSGE